MMGGCLSALVWLAREMVTEYCGMRGMSLRWKQGQACASRHVAAVMLLMAAHKLLVMLVAGVSMPRAMSFPAPELLLVKPSVLKLLAMTTSLLDAEETERSGPPTETVMVAPAVLFSACTDIVFQNVQAIRRILNSRHRHIIARDAVGSERRSPATETVVMEPPVLILARSAPVI